MPPELPFPLSSPVVSSPDPASVKKNGGEIARSLLRYPYFVDFSRGDQNTFCISPPT